ncbi:HNH endonuclease [Arthrobacter gengyunqii]|uniref:HNH endonuclease n=1 Tax=Arthrobacter gengyunqii TaxID=2886940 RepID=A0A9X1S607_9MICC|nr:HNH endonuclease signature motif containing protein [Arthrobacter gengyunqii]MCC3270025.1 HNH endonuclease [Arthrobacter gengyunqii]UOY95054.1 HNH endonuclease [Arthrobacter gengyunqii]
MYYSTGRLVASNQVSRVANRPASNLTAGRVFNPSVTRDALEAAERVRLIDEIRALEELKCAVAAAQARAAAAFDESTRAAQSRAGLRAEQLGRGVAAQIALARRESPHNGAKLLGLARILSTEMPWTLKALAAGVISEWRATILVRETACLSLAHRQQVDKLIAGNPAELEQLGDRKLIARIKSLSYGLDPHSVVNRAAKAAADRYVSCRPAPDTMAYVSALLPVAQGVSVFAALTKEAHRLRAAGDPRSKGQIMADTFVERSTGQARAEDVRVEVQLIMTDRALLHGILPTAGSGLNREPAPASASASTSTSTSTSGEDSIPDGSEPALLAGYGVVPAQWARDLILSSRAGSDRHTGRGRRTEVWLRRLYTEPASGRLTAMDSRARLVPAGLARLIATRDQLCRTPWCGAPIRHFDHIKPFRNGGPTNAENVQGLCEACNQAKEAPGWSASAVSVAAPAAGKCGSGNAAGRHTVLTKTPTGHIYRSTAPPLPTG